MQQRLTDVFKWQRPACKGLPEDCSRQSGTSAYRHKQETGTLLAMADMLVPHWCVLRVNHSLHVAPSTTCAARS